MSATTTFTIHPVRAPTDLSDAIHLFSAYERWLAMDLTPQNFAAELAGLPGEYAPPHGDLLLARDATGAAIGCVALRRLPESYDARIQGRPDLQVCEMKRLFVTEGGRGAGVGRALVEKSLGVAREMGYGGMKLDTLPRLVEAIRMYRRLGFVETKRYHEIPIECVFFELDLGVGDDYDRVPTV